MFATNGIILIIIHGKISINLLIDSQKETLYSLYIIYHLLNRLILKTVTCMYVLFNLILLKIKTKTIITINIKI